MLMMLVQITGVLGPSIEHPELKPHRLYLQYGGERRSLADGRWFIFALTIPAIPEWGRRSLAAGSSTFFGMVEG